jgi:lipoprotein-anchoring transpeptidase ErfK/SrfK
MSHRFISTASLAALVAALALASGSARAQQFAVITVPTQSQIAPQAADPAPAAEPGDDEDAQLPARLQRQIVDYPSREAPGTVIIDTAHTYLYYVLGDGNALRYGIGVGREGFTWSGINKVARKAEWPDWYPPPEMIARQPYLPRMTAGGPGNPLGARAMYIGNTEYRVHGTNDPTTIGKRVSSGCIRLTNEDVEDLYNRVQLGAKVIVLPQTAVAQAPAKARDVSLSSSYAPESGAQRTWAGIRPASLY